jgi:hypothetical protein
MQRLFVGCQDTAHFTIIPVLGYSIKRGLSQDIWILTLGSPSTARPLVATNYAEGQAVLSPDGRAIAYVSDESGSAEVYVDAFPEPQTKRPVSAGGGVRPSGGRTAVSCTTSVRIAP